jgi:hypothetical protein
MPHLDGTDDGVGYGVRGQSSLANGVGVQGMSSQADGVQGQTQSSQNAGVSGVNNSGGSGVHGAANWDGDTSHVSGNGVTGVTNIPCSNSAGVAGINASGGPDDLYSCGPGVYGLANGFGSGVYGVHNAPSDLSLFGEAGVWGDSTDGCGVYGTSTISVPVNSPGINLAAFAGVRGSCAQGIGVYGTGGLYAGQFDGNVRVNGTLSAYVTNVGVSGIYGNSMLFDAVVGESQSDANAGVTGRNLTSGANGGVGIYGVGGLYAGKFDGNVRVNGDVQVTGDVLLVNQGGDVAEDFEVEPESPNVEPGTVLIINEEGNLCASESPYDTRVAGVVAGAGDLKPAIVLQRLPSTKLRLPIALVGKAFCKVDANFGSIAAGDLLTTSPTPGHAMKVAERSRALGAVIGKALASLDAGVGLIPILVSPR